MASVTLKRPEPLPPTAYVLELSEHEALYVYAALVGASPVMEFEDGGDPVYDALGEAFAEAGITDHFDHDDYAASNGNLKRL